MWQRFTERACGVLSYAQEEAARSSEDLVAPEHLLLGLVRRQDTVAARILDQLGVSLGRIQAEIEAQNPQEQGSIQRKAKRLLTVRAKRVIDLAYDEARELGNDYIGTEHLLLGLIREDEGLAGCTLTKLGVGLEKTRKEILWLNSVSDKGNDPQKPSWWAGLFSKKPSGSSSGRK